MLSLALARRGSIVAEAVSLYQPQQDREIIILNNTNFNTELIQHKYAFAHIKLVEYYVAYCGFCARFKLTYSKLAKDIFAWRNVLRASAIDLAISNNSPIAQAWRIDTVPTLRLHPPPAQKSAAQLHRRASELRDAATSGGLELHTKMYEAFNATQLMTHTLNSQEFSKNDADAIKVMLVDYVAEYVSKTPASDLPPNWPNLRPVAETQLGELLREHPRQELFLLIEYGASSSSSSSSSSDTRPHNVPLEIMLELSSSAASKAVRYVRANDNRQLIDDVIQLMERANERSTQTTTLSTTGSNDDAATLASSSSQQQQHSMEQVQMLKNILSSDASSSQQQNGIMLIHFDDSHSPSIKTASRVAAASTAPLPHVTIVSGSDLVSMERSVANEIQIGDINRAKRSPTSNLIINHAQQTRSSATQQRTRRNADAADPILDKMSAQRKIELLSLYIKQTYTETSEDRDFVRRLAEFDAQRYALVAQAANGDRYESDKLVNKPNSSANEHSVTAMISNLFSSQQQQHQQPDKQHQYALSLQSVSSCNGYEDKIKAIRYMLFNEIPRKNIADKSYAEQMETLNTLVNLVSVIKQYFPLPNSASVQFIDGVHAYLSAQQQRLASDNGRTEGRRFDLRAFKQELKRLEADGKRLPEVKEWVACKQTGYPCALWLLFHTLTAFEYQKISQIRQPALAQSLSSQPPPPVLRSLSSDAAAAPEQSAQHAGDSSSAIVNNQPIPEAITIAANASASDHAANVERLVSPPSTTTSLSLTIASNGNNRSNRNVDGALNSGKAPQMSEADLPVPVLIAMRDYITSFFSCEDCATHFRQESKDLTFERLRHTEQPAYSVLWLWDTHNRVSKRLSVDPAANLRPKSWFPSFRLCPKCYRRPPSYLNDASADAVTIFQESIDWNKAEVLEHLVREYTRHPMDHAMSIFGYPIISVYGYLIMCGLCLIVVVLLVPIAMNYAERRRRHKATLLNGNGAHYTMELQ